MILRAEKLLERTEVCFALLTCNHRITENQHVRTRGDGIAFVAVIRFDFVKHNARRTGKVSAGGKTENRNLVGLDFPLVRMGADNLDGAERILLRGGPAVRSNTVFQNKSVEAERIESFRNHAAFVRGAGVVAAAREDDDAAAHFVAGQETGREIGLERIGFAGSGLAVAPQHHSRFKFHRRSLRSW